MAFCGTALKRHFLRLLEIELQRVLGKVKQITVRNVLMTCERWMFRNTSRTSKLYQKPDVCRKAEIVPLTRAQKDLLES